MGLNVIKVFVLLFQYFQAGKPHQMRADPVAEELGGKGPTVKFTKGSLPSLLTNFTEGSQTLTPPHYSP